MRPHVTSALFFLATASTLVLLPAHASPPLSHASTPGFEMVTGRLSAPTGQPPAQTARSFAAERAGLAESTLTTATQALEDGSLVEVTAVHRGIPVLGNDAAVRVDDEGRVRWMRSALHTIDDTLSLEPSLDAHEALHLAGAPSVDVDAVAETRAHLVVWAPPAASPRLAWRLRLPVDVARLEAWDTLVDAHTGAIITRRNRILRANSHRAEVYPENPLTTPDPIEVTFDDLPDGATTLTGPDVIATTCVDDQQCREFEGGAAHICAFEQVAVTDSYGSFLGIDLPDDPVDLSDAFAEVSAYYYTKNAYEFFRQVTGVRASRLLGRR